jgi:hypothetical protein
MSFYAAGVTATTLDPNATKYAEDTSETFQLSGGLVLIATVVDPSPGVRAGMSLERFQGGEFVEVLPATWSAEETLQSGNYSESGIFRLRAFMLNPSTEVTLASPSAYLEVIIEEEL